MKDQTQQQQQWDHSVDVVVVGSGAGAMTAALRANDLGQEVLVLEKSDQYGGTSAVSGGGIWVPNNHRITALGGQDSDAAAIEYIKTVMREEGQDEAINEDGRIEAYVANATRMVDYLRHDADVHFEAQSEYTDYYPELKGGMPGYRSMDPKPFNAAKLGAEFHNLREPSPGTLMMGRMSLGMKEARILMCRGKGWLKVTLQILWRYYKDLRWRGKSKRDRYLCLGNALVGALRHAMAQKGIPLWLGSPMTELVKQDGKVIGVVIQQNGQSQRIQARHGVVLAAGGFERNQKMREQYLPQPTQAQWSATPLHNTGDAIVAGQQQGAATALMEHSWWAPTVHVPGEEKQRAVFVERNLPGCILVNSAGKRFVNEGAPYNDIGYAMYKSHKAGNGGVPCYMVFDATFRQKYPAGPLIPGYAKPDSALSKRHRSCFEKADTLEALAAMIDIEPAALTQTVSQFNQHAKVGKDPEFGKGESLFDRYYGDPNVQPNPCVAPLDKGPFYAMRIDAGDIGTKGGLQTDVDARVLDESGAAIEGLYAIGNTAASVMGPTYPGAGSTIGPAMTFGYLAANHIQARQAECGAKGISETAEAVA
ncbi:FAD-binding protein [Ferrimonas pelagia]|uniref:3-oxosteroid 1-dehydrogenase n=1 Tax=Ferrimonas pelagia TaxID=1177826 RepID=A0ABP9EP18_9GAMM